MAASVVAVCCVIALLVPAAVTTFGVGTTKTAAGSTRLTANGLAFKRTGAGEDKAVRQLCASIGPNASVVIVDSLTADRFSQVIRGMCATPTARMDSPDAGLGGGRRGGYSSGPGGARFCWRSSNLSSRPTAAARSRCSTC